MEDVENLCVHAGYFYPEKDRTPSGFYYDVTVTVTTDDVFGCVYIEAENDIRLVLDYDDVVKLHSILDKLINKNHK